MPLCRSQKVARNAFTAGARSAFLDRVLLGLAVIGLARAGGALAGDAALTAAANIPEANASRTSAFLSAPIASPVYASPLYSRPLYARPLDSQPLLSAPGTYPLPDLTEPKIYSGKDFRPRGRSVYEFDPRGGGSSEDNLAFDKTIWQRLSEYRTRDRVRVLTLWESGVSAVSLQTDRKGDPWLQFTSKLNTRGNATHGLLDRLLPVTSFTGNGSHTVMPHPAGSSPAGKSSGPFSALHFGSSATP